MFYGYNGTGKTQGAHVVAKNSSAEILKHMAKTIAYNAQGRKNITVELFKIFDEAKKIAATGKAVVILIDEVDVLNEEIIKEFFTSLRACLDCINDNPNIIVILTSNKLEDIDTGVLQRCSKVHWPIPSAENRLEIFKFYANKFKMNIPETVIKEWAKKAIAFTGREIENIFQGEHSFCIQTGKPLRLKAMEESMDKIIECKKSQNTYFELTPNVKKTLMDGIKEIISIIFGD
ncbi:MAG TPA: ATP-binding protein [Candidatus Babeliales bacterium]|nr:ATP-binding protein [Candidatus Babeliales bacterium]